MRFWLSFSGFIGLLYMGFQWQAGRLHFSRDPASLSGNTCEGKRTCAVVYVAPWCPSCRAEIPHTQSLLARTRAGDTGVKVVVGLGRAPGDNERMARRIANAGVTIDADETIARQLGVHAVPSFTVLDKVGTKLVEGQDAYVWVMEKFGR